MKRRSSQQETPLFSTLYDELRRCAVQFLSRGTPHSLQPTMLVNEVWLRLANRERAPGPSWNDRAHFIRTASRAMRSIVVDHARRRRASKRGGDRERVELDTLVSIYEERTDLSALDAALTRLESIDDHLARVVELRFFGGMNIHETADALSVSSSTIERWWRVARAWLRSELEE